MAAESTTGVILRTRPLTETSLIVHWLTPDLGRLAVVAKGARRPKSSFRGQIDLFYLADFSFQRSRRSDLHTLREVSVREFNTSLRGELGYLQQACYFSNLIEQNTQPEAPVPGLFELLAGALRTLPNIPPRSLTVFAFEIKLLEDLGLRPDFRKTSLSFGTQEILNRALESDWPTLARLQLSERQETEIQQFLQGFLLQHLGRVPLGRAAVV